MNCGGVSLTGFGQGDYQTAKDHVDFGVEKALNKHEPIIRTYRANASPWYVFKLTVELWPLPAPIDKEDECPPTMSSRISSWTRVS